jgi:cell wall-associated NlpC family hydrolase
LSYAVPGALAPSTTGFSSTGHLRRVLIALIAVAVATSVVAITAPPPAQAAGGSQADKIVRLAKDKLGSRFRMGATGPRVFDCSGLVFRVYQQAGLLGKIGGGRKRAVTYYHWFKARGLTSRGNPQPGDLVWWRTRDGRIGHMGLWIGDGRALSALINPYGVRVHGLTGVGARFIAFGHVRLDS